MTANKRYLRIPPSLLLALLKGVGRYGIVTSESTVAYGRTNRLYRVSTESLTFRGIIAYIPTRGHTHVIGLNVAKVLFKEVP